VKHIQGFLASPSLWKEKQFGLQQFEIPPIDLSTFEPQPIPKNLRLGHQIEYIFHQILSHSDSYEVLAHNIQIKKENETIGELDFIIRFRESRKLLHIELTYKFYIIDPTIPEPIHRLMGPNKKDLFYTKLKKTKEKQLPLIRTKEGQKALKNLGIHAEELEQQVLFIGQLFKPYNLKTPSIHPLNTECIVGFWIRISDFESDVFKKYQYHVTYKNEWIHIPHQDVIWLSHDAILQEIQLKHLQKRAPIVWINKNNETIEKCFVVWW